MKNCTGRNCPVQVGKIDPATCKNENCPWRTVPLTNADRIRAMTNEELASFLAVCDASRFRIRCDTEEVRAETWRWLDWLKQEVDNGGGLNVV